MTTRYTAIKHWFSPLFAKLDGGTVLFSFFVFSLILSYQPLVHFGVISGANLDISLPVVAAIIVIGFSLSRIYAKRNELIVLVSVKIFFLFCFLNTASILWSDNKPRAILETGFLWMLFLLFISIHVWFQRLNQNRRVLFAVFSASVLFACLLSWWQVFGDAVGVSPTYTLLPAAYQSAVFGFARPTGFALEPQFLGSLLIIPILAASHFLLQGRRDSIYKIVLLVTFVTLIATISRGALFATAIGLVLLFLFIRTSLSNYIKVVGLLITGVLLSILLLATAAQTNNRDAIDGRSAIVGVVDQVSLGAIDISSLTQEPETPNTAPSTPAPSSSTPVQPSAATPTSPTYVAESTNSRLLMAKEALSLWTSDIRTFLFGIGVGGFGAAIHEKNNSYALNSIVNNEYLQIIAELGVIGLLLFATLLLLPVYRLIKVGNWLFVSLLSAFYLQWLFFSGHVNVMHVWLLIAVAYAILEIKIPSTKK